MDASATTDDGSGTSANIPSPTLNTTSSEEETTKSEPKVADQREKDLAQSPIKPNFGVIIHDGSELSATTPRSDETSAAEEAEFAAASVQKNENYSPDEVGTARPRVPVRTKKQIILNQIQEQNGNEEHAKQEIKAETSNQENKENKTWKMLDAGCNEAPDGPVKLRKELGLLNCVGLIIGNIIGTGIFVSPRTVLHYAGSVGMSLSVWVATGFMSMIGALCYTELGTMIPQSGGNYTYLLEAFGPLPAFLYLWMVVMISIPGSRAIGALTFANYILQPFFPGCQEPPQSAVTIVGILLVVTLTWINSRKVKWATTVQDVLALTKVLALIMIIVVGVNHLAWGRSQHFQDPMAGSNWSPVLIATAFYHTLFSYGGWDSLNMIMEELKDPFKNMPRAVAISVSSVMVIYVFTNVAYFAVLSTDQMLASTAVAVTFGNLTLGVMAWTIPLFVGCSTAGGLNGYIFSTARLILVSSRRGHLPRALSLIHAHNYTPVTALMFSTAISLIMFVASDVRVLINYLAFAGSVFELGCIGAFFWFRINQPERHRPIKVWLGFPIMHLIIMGFLTVFPVIRQPLEVVAALVVIGTGIPVYYLSIHRQDKPNKLLYAMDKVTYVCQMMFLAVPEERIN
ncbi:Y+L amino acid transporter 2-like [Procambarus clarkii]|uniref:Y+L amino acid transporter 2-like n=1 Tax=Procambarus clarkii TaxID=6728 RepID=UPI0037428069